MSICLFLLLLLFSPSLQLHLRTSQAQNWRQSTTSTSLEHHKHRVATSSAGRWCPRRQAAPTNETSEAPWSSSTAWQRSARTSSWSCKCKSAQCDWLRHGRRWSNSGLKEWPVHFKEIPEKQMNVTYLSKCDKNIPHMETLNVLFMLKKSAFDNKEWNLPVLELFDFIFFCK